MDGGLTVVMLVAADLFTASSGCFVNETTVRSQSSVPTPCTYLPPGLPDATEPWPLLAHGPSGVNDTGSVLATAKDTRLAILS